MNNIKSKFSIKDLENLSGIKAHTIRIWEKRYNLLKPNRTNTNIRYYSIESLQRLLNVSYLNKNGYKISKIAKLKSKNIPVLVKDIASKISTNNHYVNVFKMAMLNFDQNLFYNTYNELIKKLDFENTFYSVFLPLLDDIGLLWQTDTINIAHEHFIVELIKKKILTTTDEAQSKFKLTKNNTTYVLFLPDNEIHELGLLFINYKLSVLGYKSIYLGQSVPIESLVFIGDYYNNITYISSFTIKPERELLNNYLEEFNNKLLKNTTNKLLVSTRLANQENNNIPLNISLYKSTKTLLNEHFNHTIKQGNE